MAVTVGKSLRASWTAALTGAGLLVVGSAPAFPAAADETVVSVDDDRFRPPTVAVTAGDKIVWSHDGDHIHTVTADDGSFDSGDLRPGDTFTLRIRRTGTFAYSCRYHGKPDGEGMSGVVEVQEPDEADGKSDSSSTTSTTTATTTAPPATSSTTSPPSTSSTSTASTTAPPDSTTTSSSSTTTAPQATTTTAAPAEGGAEDTPSATGQPARPPAPAPPSTVPAPTSRAADASGAGLPATVPSTTSSSQPPLVWVWPRLEPSPTESLPRSRRERLSESLDKGVSRESSQPYGDSALSWPVAGLVFAIVVTLAGGSALLSRLWPWPRWR